MTSNPTAVAAHAVRWFDRSEAAVDVYGPLDGALHLFVLSSPMVAAFLDPRRAGWVDEEDEWLGEADIVLTPPQPIAVHHLRGVVDLVASSPRRMALSDADWDAIGEDDFD